MKLVTPILAQAYPNPVIYQTNKYDCLIVRIGSTVRHFANQWECVWQPSKHPKRLRLWRKPRPFWGTIGIFGLTQENPTTAVISFGTEITVAWELRFLTYDTVIMMTCCFGAFTYIPPVTRIFHDGLGFIGHGALNHTTHFVKLEPSADFICTRKFNFKNLLKWKNVNKTVNNLI